MITNKLKQLVLTLVRAGREKQQAIRDVTEAYTLTDKQAAELKEEVNKHENVEE